MPNADLKQTIKHQIAEILKSNPPGYGRATIIARVTATDDREQINQCLEDMRGIGDIQFRHNRYEITPIGRSSYSELNIPENKTYEQPSAEPADKNLPTSDDQFITEVIRYETPDGKLHETHADAKNHWRELLIDNHIDEFISNAYEVTFAMSAETREILRAYVKWANL